VPGAGARAPDRTVECIPWAQGHRSAILAWPSRIRRAAGPQGFYGDGIEHGFPGLRRRQRASQYGAARPRVQPVQAIDRDRRPSSVRCLLTDLGPLPLHLTQPYVRQCRSQFLPMTLLIPEVWIPKRFFPV